MNDFQRPVADGKAAVRVLRGLGDDLRNSPGALRDRAARLFARTPPAHAVQRQPRVRQGGIPSNRFEALRLLERVSPAPGVKVGKGE
jgi:hypothetical protein